MEVPNTQVLGCGTLHLGCVWHGPHHFQSYQGVQGPSLGNCFFSVVGGLQQVMLRHQVRARGACVAAITGCQPKVCGQGVCGLLGCQPKTGMAQKLWISFGPGLRVVWGLGCMGHKGCKGTGPVAVARGCQ